MIMMPFPFTFNLPVPGLTNPFLRSRSEQIQNPMAMLPPTPVDRSHANANNNVNINVQNHRRKIPITRPRPPPSPPARNPAPLSRKRGWEPTFIGASRSTTPLACSGYLDTPAKYRDMVQAERSASADEFHEVEMFADTEMPPPAKRRRGLAGSIVSTALSAALIGTAVGLTVYRLWRDRGKSPPRLEEESNPHQNQAPPPPYQQGAWTPDSQPQLTNGDANTNARGPSAPPATPRRKRERRLVNSANKRNSTCRRGRAHTIAHRAPASAPAQTSTFPNPQPEFDFPAASGLEEPIEVDDQMDWIGDKLSALIAEGKRALSREVVVMSDAQEDEVDDASGAWEDAVPQSASQHASPSRNSSIRRAGTKRPRSLISPSAYSLYSQDTHRHHESLSPSSSPTKSTFSEFAPSSSAPALGTPIRGVGMGYDNMGGSNVTPSTSYTGEWQEDERSWESPEVREAMEKARARFRR